MTSTEWHATPQALARLTADPTTVDTITASSLEAHLLGCDDCRRAMAAAIDPIALDTSWAGVADRIDRPRTTGPERALRRLGIDEGVARLLVATTGLKASGLAALGVLAAIAVGLSRRVDAVGPFLAIAPVLPLAAVAASFAAVTDPAGEAGVATALHGVGLVARRAVAVLGVTFVMLGVAALALPQLGGEAAAWVLPALALALGALALGTWLSVETAFALLGGGWLATVATVWWLHIDGRLDPSSLTFAVTTQSAALALALVAAVVITIRRSRFATVEVFR